MKKIYTLLFALTLLNGTIKAQLTLTRAANEPSVGDAVSRQSMDSTVALPSSLSGTNVAWTFTSLTTGTASPTMSTYKTPTAVPSASAYPTCTIVEDMGSSGFTYWKSVPSPANYELVATTINAGTITAVLVFNNTAIAAQYPMTLGYSLNDPIAGSVNAGTLTGTFSGSNNTIADGTGTLSLQNNITFTNCLRVKSTQNINLTFFTIFTGTVTNTTYSYYHASQKFPVLTVSYSKINIPIASINQTTVRIEENMAIFAGINEYNLENGLAIYPNPASDFINVSLNSNENTLVEIVDQLGQVVKSEKITSSVSKIDVSALNSGIYFVKTSIGNRSSVKKLIKD